MTDEADAGFELEDQDPVGHAPTGSIDMSKARQLGELKREKKRMADRKREVNDRIEKLEDDLLEQFAQEGARSVGLAGLGNLHLARKGFGKLKFPAGADDEEKANFKARAIARLHELDEKYPDMALRELAPQTIQWQKFTARLKEWADPKEDSTMPEELAEFFELKEDFELRLRGSS